MACSLALKASPLERKGATSGGLEISILATSPLCRKDEVPKQEENKHSRCLTFISRRQGASLSLMTFFLGASLLSFEGEALECNDYGKKELLSMFLEEYKRETLRFFERRDEETVGNA